MSFVSHLSLTNCDLVPVARQRYGVNTPLAHVDGGAGLIYRLPLGWGMSETLEKICEDCGSTEWAVYYAAEVSEFDNDGKLYCVDCCAFCEDDEE